MEFPERALVWLMRFAGVLLMTALFPAVMPFAWMDSVHRHLGMGKLPEIPMVIYMARSLSAMYALHGAIVYFVSLNVRSYLPLVRFLAVMGILFGVGMILIDLSIGIPLAWALCEGPLIILLGVLMLRLAIHVQKSVKPAA